MKSPLGTRYLICRMDRLSLPWYGKAWKNHFSGMAKLHVNKVNMGISIGKISLIDLHLWIPKV